MNEVVLDVDNILNKLQDLSSKELRVIAKCSEKIIENRVIKIKLDSESNKGEINE